MSSSPPGSSPGSIAAATAALGVALAAAIPLLQTDRIGRSVLSPDRLRAKRRREQLHRLERELMRRTVEIRARLQGRTGFRFNPGEDRAFTDLLTKEEEYDALVDEALDERGEAPIVVAIEPDPDDERAGGEVYLYLAFPPAGGGEEEVAGGAKKKWRRVQAPLVPVCKRLADAFESKLTSTALCFVADASSGLGSEVIGRVAEGCGAGAVLIREPAWMASVASLISSGVITKSKMERAVFALCRLEAWRVRRDVGASRTVVVTIPGQGCVPPLVPMLQVAFPHERHVFAYDSLSESVGRGLGLLRRRGARGGKRAGDGAPSLSDVCAMPRTVTASVPVSQLRSLSRLGDVLSALPADHAGIAEAWMASVDAVIRLKADEAETGYLPFVCRLGFVLGRVGGLGDGDEDRSDLALMNVLQYVTGSRSRPLGEGVLDAAREALRNVREEVAGAAGKAVALTDAEFKTIEAVAFEHKSILIQDKTLPDTVQPAKEWSLKAARKLTGCACCAPEEEYDEEEEEGGAKGEGSAVNGGGSSKLDMSVPGAFATGLSQRAGSSSGPSRSGYVDGKATFAFDPTKFG